MNNSSNFIDLDDDGSPHYEANQPKLQWLIVSVPVISAFILYTLVRIHSTNKQRRQQLLRGEESRRATHLPVMTNVIAQPAPIYTHQNHSTSSSLYNIARPTPLLRFSSNTNNVFWQMFHSNESINQDARNNRQRYRRRGGREYLGRTQTPPPVYSITSPPKYEEVIASSSYVADDEPLAQVQSRIACINNSS